jgi:hypothetical protein
MFRQFLLYVGLLVTISPAIGQSLQPYPSNSISEQQWQTYFYEVENLHGDVTQRVRHQHLIIFKDRQNATSWIFTQLGHPAHPSWITRRLVQNDDGASIQQTGYFAGSKEQFAVFFDQQLELNKSIGEQR